MGEQRREWTAEIKRESQPTLYAWLAYNPKFDAFVTDNRLHARMFDSKEEVEAWIERVHTKDAKPVRLKV